MTPANPAHKLTPQKLLISAKLTDRQRFQRLADQGEIPTKAVLPLATVFAAARRAEAQVGTAGLKITAVGTRRYFTVLALARQPHFHVYAAGIWLANICRALHEHVVWQLQCLQKVFLNSDK